MRPFALFDLDDTLVDRRPALAEWTAKFCDRRGLGAQGAEWLHELLKDRAGPGSFAEVRDRFGLTETAEELWNAYCADIAAAVHCPSDVLAGLDGLRSAGWRIGIATNGATDIQRAKLQATGIDGHVDAVCISEEAGARKPDSAFFREAIRRCRGVPAASSSAAVGPAGHVGGVGWFVGDNPVTDIRGGNDAGLRTIWISSSMPWPSNITPPDHATSDVLDAINLLLNTDDTKGMA